LIPEPCPGLLDRFKSLQKRYEATKEMKKGRVHVGCEMADVIVKDDVEEVKRLIGGRDPRKMTIQRNEIPTDIFLPDREVEFFSLIDLAAGGGAERVFGLLYTFSEWSRREGLSSWR
jgi:hypothetical protein